MQKHRYGPGGCGAAAAAEVALHWDNKLPFYLFIYFHVDVM